MRRWFGALVVSFAMFAVGGSTAFGVTTTTTAEAVAKAAPVACDPGDGNLCVTKLYAGQHMEVGWVAVAVGVDPATGEDGLFVTYWITDPAWAITEIHFNAADTVEGITSNWAPGQFAYSFDGLSTQFFQFPIDEEPGSCHFYAAHAVVRQVVETLPSGGNLSGLTAALPDQVSMKVAYPTPGGPSYFQTTVMGGTILDGTYNGWCVDTDHTIGNNTVYSAAVYSSYEFLPSGLVEHPENLDVVNWILNQGFVGQASGCGGNYTYGDVQRAIWQLVEDDQSTAGLGDWEGCRVDEILAAAQDAGDGFVPGCDQKLAVILVPIGAVQPQVIIAQVTIIDVSVPCGDFELGDGEETAWGCGLPIREKKNWGWYFECCAQ